MNQVGLGNACNCARSNRFWTLFRDTAKRDELASLDKPAPAAWGARDAGRAARARIPGCGREEIRASQAPPTARVAGFRAHRPDSLGLGFYMKAWPTARSTSKPRCSRSRRYAEEADAAQPVATVRGTGRRAASARGEPVRGMEDQTRRRSPSGRTEKRTSHLSRKMQDSIADQKLKIQLGKALKALDKTSTMPLFSPPLAPALRSYQSVFTSTRHAIGRPEARSRSVSLRYLSLESPPHTHTYEAPTSAAQARFGQ